MARVYVFADEAGNFDFSNKVGASKYFVLGTVTMPSTGLGDELLSLRRDLAWQGAGLETTFHASTDKQIVRNEVFRVLQTASFRFDSVILEKRKAQPHLAKDEYNFYKMAWFLHFKYVAPRILNKNDELLVTAASLGTKRRYKMMRAAIEDVVWQAAWQKTLDYRVAFWPAESDPCLQIADYCTWALQRKYESGDTRSYDLIRNQIATEFDPGRLARSTTTKEKPRSASRFRQSPGALSPTEVLFSLPKGGDKNEISGPNPALEGVPSRRRTSAHLPVRASGAILSTRKGRVLIQS